jgi:hypothetical protein
MGLKTTNYVSKRLNVTLPEAYAKLTELILQKDDNVRAIFSIQSTRENIKNLAPIDKVEINFKWDRKTDPAKMAYEVAKTEVKTVETFNDKGEVVIEKVNGVLFGWDNHIVGE